MCNFYHENYDPLNDKQYMSKQMLLYFENILNMQMHSIEEKEVEICLHVAENSSKEPDVVDQGTAEGIRFNDLVYHYYEEHLLQKVRTALQRIGSGTYGYCAETGAPIGLKRLLAAPQASFCIDVQERKEREFFCN